MNKELVSCMTSRIILKWACLVILSPDIPDAAWKELRESLKIAVEVLERTGNWIWPEHPKRTEKTSRKGSWKGNRLARVRRLNQGQTAETSKDGSLLGYATFSWNSLPVYYMRKIGSFAKEKVYFRKSLTNLIFRGKQRYRNKSWHDSLAEIGNNVQLPLKVVWAAALMRTSLICERNIYIWNQGTEYDLPKDI